MTINIKDLLDLTQKALLCLTQPIIDNPTITAAAALTLTAIAAATIKLNMKPKPAPIEEISSTEQRPPAPPTVPAPQLADTEKTCCSLFSGLGCGSSN